jgi:hyperosmotically inducible protein
MRTIKKGIIAIGAALVLTVSAAIGAPATSNKTETGGQQQQVSEQVRKELVTLPYYGVFDNLAYKVEGSTVTLYGQVVRPVTRSDAERRVARINGVSRVVNNIEVLPVSPFDDAVRVRTYRAIFSTGGLSRYAMGANPSIHIVVKGGHITLEGVVSNESDRNLAYMAAMNVPGVFSVKNNLQTERSARGAY